MNRRSLTADRWRDLIRQQRRSGLSIAAFCAEHDVAVSTYFVWRRKVEAGDAPTPPAFVELTPAIERSTAVAATGAAVATTAPARPGESAHAPIELLLPGGLILRVRQGFDAGTLRQMVEALR